MSVTEGQQILIRRIKTMANPPNIADPNGQSVDPPRYDIQVAGGGSPRTFDLAGTTESFPEILVRVETQDGDFATENDALVARLEVRFAPGSKFEGVEIDTPPDVRPPIRTGGIYAVPVIIRGRYVFNPRA